MQDDRYEPVPVLRGDGRHDIGDDVRAAIVHRLISDWSRDPDLTSEKVRQLAMWAAASVRALLHELGTLRDLTQPAMRLPDGEGRAQLDIVKLLAEVEDPYEDFEGNGIACRFCFNRRDELHQWRCAWILARQSVGVGSVPPQEKP